MSRLPTVTQLFAPRIAESGESSYNIRMMFRDIPVAVNIIDNIEQERVCCLALSKMWMSCESFQGEE